MFDQIFTSSPSANCLNGASECFKETQAGLTPRQSVRGPLPGNALHLGEVYRTGIQYQISLLS